MPEAIATTKRKFYKALDALNIGTSQALPPTADPGNQKRPVSAATAFDEARERVRKRLRHSTSTSSFSTISQTPPPIAVPSKATVTSATRSTRKSDVAKDESPPNFAPWSHDAFLSRLKTFSSVSRWHPKPERISEVEWAKRGWVCVDVNTVSCRGGCERRVVVNLDTSPTVAQANTEPVLDDVEGEDGGGGGDDDEDVEVSALEEALVARYEIEIVDAHAEICLWHKAGCKDDIYRLQVIRPSVWQPELQARFNSLLAIGDAIAQVKVKAGDKNETNTLATSRLLRSLPENILGSFDTSSEVADAAFQAALHGWHGSSEAGNQLFQCDACFQRIGLWMYQPDYRPRTRGREVGADNDDGDEETDEQSRIIDLSEMHREYCPWRNPGSQKAVGSLDGLNASQILQRVATTCARDHRRRTGDYSDTQDVQPERQGELAAEDPQPIVVPTLSREEVAAQDRERESRLRKLKNLFTMKRRPTTKVTRKVIQ